MVESPQKYVEWNDAMPKGKNKQTQEWNEREVKVTNKHEKNMLKTKLEDVKKECNRQRRTS